MKIMRKIIFLLLLVCLLPCRIAAQDIRQRTVATIIADGLNQLPANNMKKYNAVMDELASTGAVGVVEIASMLVPADKGENAVIEYALYGLVSYVTADGRVKEKDEVRKGLAQAIEKCQSNANKAFLMHLLQCCATSEDAPVFVKYINDDYLSEWAVNGLAHTEGTDEVLLQLIQKGNGNKVRLAYAAGVKNLQAAEPFLIKWLKDSNLETQKAVYYALSQCGSSLSIPVLKKAAESVCYEWTVSSDIVNCYLRLLQKISKTDEGLKAAKAAKSLLKSTYLPYVRGAALEVIVAVEGQKSIPFILEAMEDNSREYRVNALRLSENIANDYLHVSLGKMLLVKGHEEMKIDILNWMGSNHVVSQASAVIQCMEDTSEKVVIAAIKAVGKIGGDSSLSALVKQLKGPYASFSTKALLSFNGKIDSGILRALDDNDKKIQMAALDIASVRSMDVAATRVFSLLNSEDEDVKTAAYKALSGVVNHFHYDLLSRLAEEASGNYFQYIQEALKNALSSLSKEEQYAISMSYMCRSKKPYLYYPNLAQAGTDNAIEELYKGSRGAFKKESMEALLQIRNIKMIDILYKIAVSDKAYTSAALKRYIDLVDKSSYNAICKYQLYRKALELTSDANIQNRLIQLLGETYTYPAFMLVSKYMDHKATAEKAAGAVRNIISKNPEHLGGDPVRKVLEKAICCFKEKGDADAGYAIDDIKKMLQELSDAPYIPLFGNTEWNSFTWPMGKQLKINNKVDNSMSGWEKTSVGFKFLGGKESILSTGNYENFELYFEWKGAGKAGLGIRSIRQIDLGGEKSGALSYNVEGKNVPDKMSDNAKNEWNTVYVKVHNDRVTVKVNGVVTTNNVILENSSERHVPAYQRGKLLLIGIEQPVEFRDMYIRELPSTPVFELSEIERKDGFEVLFDGTSTHKWTGNTIDYVPVNGTIYVTAEYGGSGNLYTVKEYSDFILRFEFSFMNEGVNNGVGIRTPMGVDAAYEGMEIQILDHDAPIYKGLRHYQQHGSVYGIIPAKRVKFPALGEWNTEEIRAVGDHITVTVNGEVILDGNIREACKGHNVSPDGSGTNPYTVDNKNHPGLFNKSGHIGFLGHGAGIKFRNVRIKDLSK